MSVIPCNSDTVLFVIWSAILCNGVTSNFIAALLVCNDDCIISLNKKEKERILLFVIYTQGTIGNTRSKTENITTLSLS